MGQLSDVDLVCSTCVNSNLLECIRISSCASIEERYIFHATFYSRDITRSKAKARKIIEWQILLHYLTYCNLEVMYICAVILFIGNLWSLYIYGTQKRRARPPGQRRVG